MELRMSKSEFVWHLKRAKYPVLIARGDSPREVRYQIGSDVKWDPSIYPYTDTPIGRVRGDVVEIHRFRMKPDESRDQFDARHRQLGRIYKRWITGWYIGKKARIHVCPLCGAKP